MQLNYLIISVCMLLLPPISVIADSGPMRVEFNVNAEVFQLIPHGEEGLLVFYETANEADELSKEWFFIFYDVNLQPLWSMEIPIFLEHAYREYYVDDNKIYLAFQHTGRSRSGDFNFQIVIIDLDETGYIIHNSTLPDRADLVKFITHNDKAFAAFNYPREQALLLIRDLDSGEESIVRFTDRPTFINDLSIAPGTAEITVAVTIYVSRRESALYLNTYDFSANMLRSGLLAPAEPSEKLLNAQLHFLSPAELFVLGSFNNLNGRMSRPEEGERGAQSEGFYIARLVNGEQEYIRFHRLLDFKNITQILNNQQLATATNLLKRQNRRGREQVLNYDFIIHDLLIHNDQFIMVADAYYPEYRQVSTMSYDFYGRPMPYYYTVFDGYRYFNAFAVSFDKNGNLNWSNGLKIWDVRSMRLQRRTAFQIDGDEMVLFYSHDGKIVSKVIEGYDEIGAVENLRIATRHAGDIQLDSSQGMIRHWYGNHFIAYGYQTLRNNFIGGGSRRKVFYVNKIAFD